MMHHLHPQEKGFRTKLFIIIIYKIIDKNRNMRREKISYIYYFAWNNSGRIIIIMII